MPALRKVKQEPLGLRLGGLLFMPESNYSADRDREVMATIGGRRKAAIHGKTRTDEGLWDSGWVILSRTAVTTACDKGSRNVVLQVTSFLGNLAC